MKCAGAPAHNPVHSEIDLARAGTQQGYLRLPYSTHRSAYGWIPIPIASIRNGSGPRVLVMAGNHGDEFEGQIIVSRLIRELDATQVNGQLILLPMANFPAAAAGSRVSPLDGGNLNRSFPGDPSGSPTAIIADLIENQLMRGSDYVLDLHSGGSSLLYDGACLMALDPHDTARRAALRELMAPLGARHGCLLLKPNPVSSTSAARRQGAVGIVAELGGAGTVSRAILQLAWQGVLRFLCQIGVLTVSPEPLPAAPPMQLRQIDALRHHVYATDRGIFEPLIELGDTVAPAQLVALLHQPDTPGREPVRIVSSGDGTVICRRVPALTERGDCLFQLGAATD